MSSPSTPDTSPPDDADRELADDALPRVEPPTAGFLLQLFFIPMLIVGIVVLVFFSLSWLSQSETDLEQVVKELERGGTGTWAKALMLADLLRDPRYEKRKSDPALAGRLAAVLKASIDANQQEEEPLKLRFFLARACGEFRVTEPLPALIIAAATERTPQEAEVRVAALEGISVLAGNCPPGALLANSDLLPAVNKALQEQADIANPSDVKAKLRERGAFLLGVLGGREQLEQLVGLLSDPLPNVRYNAAIGLCRYGDQRAVPYLLDMLDPENPEIVLGESKEAQKQWKRETVITNALQGVMSLVKAKPNADYSEIAKALTRLKESNLGGQLRAKAADVLYGLPKPLEK